MAELADAQDLKSCGVTPVPVRSRSRAASQKNNLYAQIAQLVEQWTENPRVTGSIPVLGTIMREWLSGRASPCQGEGREFESRLALFSFKRESKNL